MVGIPLDHRPAALSPAPVPHEPIMRPTWFPAAFCLACALGAITPSRADVVDTTGASTASSAPLSALSWGRLQGRLSFATSSTSLRPDASSTPDAPFKVSTLSLMGDLKRGRDSILTDLAPELSTAAMWPEG